MFVENLTDAQLEQLHFELTSDLVKVIDTSRDDTGVQHGIYVVFSHNDNKETWKYEDDELPSLDDMIKADLDIHILYDFMYRTFGNKYLLYLLRSKLGFDEDTIKSFANTMADDKEISIETKSGTLTAGRCGDIDYPGLYIVLTPKTNIKTSGAIDIAIVESPNDSDEVSAYIYDDIWSDEWQHKFSIKNQEITQFVQNLRG